jgi:hypothetical protein
LEAAALALMHNSETIPYYSRISFLVFAGKHRGKFEHPRYEIAPEPTGHGLPLSKCEAYNRVYEQPQLFSRYFEDDASFVWKQPTAK